MKMSLCNTFRLLVVSFIVVLSSIDSPAIAFTLRRTTSGAKSNQDLTVEESVVSETRRDFKAQDDFQLFLNKTNNSTKNPRHFVPTNAAKKVHTENHVYDQNTNISPTETIISQETNFDEKGTESAIPMTTTEFGPVTTSFVMEEDTSYMPFDFKKGLEIETTTTFDTLDTKTEDIYVPTETSIFFTMNKTISDKSQHNSNKSEFEIKVQKQATIPSYKLRPNPKWRKYTTIERKRTLPSSDENVSKSQKQEAIMNAESKHLRITLQDTVTSDIPSLEHLKNDLITSKVNIQVLESRSDLIRTQESLNINASLNITPKILSTEVNSPLSTVESIRAGFLNFSGKTTTEEVTTEKETSDFKINNNDPLRSMFETENPEIDILEEKTGTKIESQSVLNEDAIKEELLKEELINDSEENAQRQRDDFDNIKKSEISAIINTNPENSTQSNSFLDDSLSVKPISSDKTKNFTLYAVNPNYKPMKKIDVLPPKQFVRDPDDNSWRNESLSSLGIVFKPKNSSKPFTQVLKNKTEIEWNNMSDKGSKNDIPDLRERLQKMAEMRKSKRKKIDSFGNVYFDYEENINSAESTSPLIDKTTTSIPTLSPHLHNIYQNESNLSTDEPNGNSKTVPTSLKSITDSVKQNLYSTKKSKKFFNIPEYYDAMDEDDIDYINMARIDLKKFTTSLRPKTPFLSPTTVAEQSEWPMVKKPSYNIMPERKATVQYFPPLTTQKVNINDYDNDFKLRVESFTTETESPKHVLPVSGDRSPPPAIQNKIVYDQHHKDIESNYAITSKPDFTKDSMVTQRPLTTEPGFGLINSDGGFDRGTYVIKHYKDFINEAAKDLEYDKNMDYIPYTEAPAEGVTKADLLGYEKDKDRITIDNAYDYEAQFRRDVLQRFVDNFNQNSDRYKSNFPIIFNNSIIHRDTPDGRQVASSRALMRGLYGSELVRPNTAARKKSCEPNCENITVELSPAYELHYYVPEQEEREEAVPQPVTLPYQYRL